MLMPNKYIPINNRSSVVKQSDNSFKSNDQPVKSYDHTIESDDKTVIILTLFHSSDYVDSFFTLVNNFTYPKSLTSIGILEGDSEDYNETMKKLNDNINNNKVLYKRISLVHKNANMKISQTNRRSPNIQLFRRKKLAELRNYLLKETLNNENYVLWIDSDVIISPHNNIIELMMSIDKDVVVPNCLLDTSNDARYDANTWILTPEVIKYISKKDKNYFLVNPYINYPITWMKTIYEYRDVNKPLLYQIEVDAVGGTMILAKSKVFHSGVVFPEDLFDHCVETEGFGRMAKKNGFELIGLPNLIIYHAHNR